MDDTPLTAESLIAKYSNVEGFDIEALRRVLAHGVVKSLPYLDMLIEKRGLFGPLTAFCWIARSGRVYTCGYGGHEALLEQMGIYTNTAEEAGWVRVSGLKEAQIPCNVQGRYAPTPQQVRVLKKMGAWEYVEDDPHAVWTRMRLYDDQPVLTDYE